MNLFDQQLDDYLKSNSPLAFRLRPKTLDEFIGQKEIIGPGRILRRAIEQDKIQSAVFWGPPGSGKTTLASIIANTTKRYFEPLSAVTSDVAEVRRVISAARDRNLLESRGTVVFIDEIHRFNKNQQDALLPAVEEGVITLIGATTENPFFEVNAPLLSRSRVFQFKSLEEDEMEQIFNKVILNEKVQDKKSQIKIEESAKNHLILSSNGDARLLINALEMLILTAEPDQSGARIISLTDAEEAVQKRFIVYDKKGDSHYDTISAFIKSIRGSDPDAAIYWLSRMLYAGEDPKFIARRLIISASEDIGLADPQALQIAVATAQAVDFVGMPEARINLAHATVYLALAQKSNSAYLSINRAYEDVENKKIDRVPSHLRDSSYRGAKKIGHGEGYRYPHEYQNHYIEQDYLPKNLLNRQYYKPAAQGQEEHLVNNWLKRKNVSEKKNNIKE